MILMFMVSFQFSLDILEDMKWALEVANTCSIHCRYSLRVAWDLVRIWSLPGRDPTFRPMHPPVAPAPPQAPTPAAASTPTRSVPCLGTTALTKTARPTTPVSYGLVTATAAISPPAAGTSANSRPRRHVAPAQRESAREAHHACGPGRSTSVR